LNKKPSRQKEGRPATRKAGKRSGQLERKAFDGVTGNNWFAQGTLLKQVGHKTSGATLNQPIPNSSPGITKTLLGR